VAYEVNFRDEAGKALTRLGRAMQKRVGKSIDRLTENPRPGQATTLVSDPGTWRVRVGDWRILYEIHDDRLVILVLDIRHRSTAY
jgi:mRNA interferase RelE/StbE